MINELGVVRLDQIVPKPITLNKRCSCSLLVHFVLDIPKII